MSSFLIFDPARAINAHAEDAFFGQVLMNIHKQLLRLMYGIRLVACFVLNQ